MNGKNPRVDVVRFGRTTCKKPVPMILASKGNGSHIDSGHKFLCSCCSRAMYAGELYLRGEGASKDKWCLGCVTIAPYDEFGHLTEDSEVCNHGCKE